MEKARIETNTFKKAYQRYASRKNV